MLDFNDPNSALLLGIGSGLLSAGGPSRTPVNLGQAFGQAMPQAMQMSQMANENQRQTQLTQMAMLDRVKKMQEAQRRQSAMEQYGKGISDPQQLARFNIAPEDYLKAQDEANKPQVVGEGASIYQGGKSVFTAPKERKLPEGMEMGPDGVPRFMPSYLSGKKDIARAGKAEISNTVTFPKEQFKNERDLRNDFQSLPTTKAYKEVQTSYDQINTALSNPSAANDLVAATKFMKLLDPGSVVRESELGMAMAATGMMDRVMNYANMVKTGQKLTDQQRADFSAAASELFKAAQGRFNESAAEYQGMAKDYGLNPERITKVSKELPRSRFVDVDGRKYAATLDPADGNYYVTKAGKKYRVEE